SAAASAAATKMGDLAKAPVAEAIRSGDGDLELVVYPHIYRYDGRYANRPWMQETADPLIQSSWSNWAELHPVTARRNGIGQGDRIQLKTAAGTIEVHAYITSGVLPEVVAVPLGQGHSAAIGTWGAIDGNPFTLIPPVVDEASGAWALGGNRVQIQRIAAAERKFISGNDQNLVTVDGSRRDLGRGIGQVIPLGEIRALNDGSKDPEPPVVHGTKI